MKLYRTFFTGFSLTLLAALSMLAAPTAPVAAQQFAPATKSGHAGPVNAASFSPDGKRVVTASTDGTSKVCDAATGKLLATLNDETG